MTLHHVGIVVDDLVAHGKAYAEFLGFTPESAVVHDPLQKVCVQFWRDRSGNLLELIAPASPDSPARNALGKGGGLNHLCYEVGNIEEQVRISIDQGAIPTTEIVPAAAFSGRRIAFVFFPKIGLVEFVEASRT